MIDKEEHKRQMLLVRCFRCGMRKERSKFTEKTLSCSWHHWCIACENTPIGDMPK